VARQVIRGAVEGPVAHPLSDIAGVADRPHVLVVGAGIIGASIVWHLRCGLHCGVNQGCGGTPLDAGMRLATSVPNLTSVSAIASARAPPEKTSATSTTFAPLRM
jgi:hypothetical protein